MEYTVIGVCNCGCGDSFIHHVEARTPKHAAAIALEKRDFSGTVIAVLNGHLTNRLSSEVSRG
jgi:hypothetical protein